MITDTTSGVPTPRTPTVGLRLDGVAACAATPEAFLPHPDLATARQVCRGCAQATACLDYALRHDVTGVWAGTSDDERRTIRRQRHIPEPRPVSAELDELVLLWRRPSSGRDDSRLTDSDITAMTAHAPAPSRPSAPDHQVLDAASTSGPGAITAA